MRVVRRAFLRISASASLPSVCLALLAPGRSHMLDWSKPGCWGEWGTGAPTVAAGAEISLSRLGWKHKHVRAPLPAACPFVRTGQGVHCVHTLATLSSHQSCVDEGATKAVQEVCCEFALNCLILSTFFHRQSFLMLLPMLDSKVKRWVHPSHFPCSSTLSIELVQWIIKNAKCILYD